MASYMSMYKYATDAYRGTMEEGPAARAEFLRSYVEAQGGEVEAIWYSAGEWDMVAVTQMPEFDSSALAQQWAALATGAFAEAVVVQVFSPDEFQAGVDKQRMAYRKPGE